ncbi:MULTISPECIES: OmpH family outer membrane protein [Parabacteroides]|uniref:OmpH family outer membrane protein n=1 Tax=Parabacteroides leei TaxID=2939491 RepID=UPI00189971DD|nr:MULTISPECIES: OmpH family outer membrane protein [Parabacteroides]MCL3850676.1 OmpH family outer membrane protein [Parabacteroides leei]
MKKLIILLLMILPLGVFAQDMKVAIVNTNELIPLMPEVTAMQETLKQMNDKYMGEMKTMQDEYEKKYADYIAQQDSLTENIKLRRMQELSDIEQRVQNFTQVARQDMDKKQQELFTPIQDKVRNAIKAVGDEKGYAYILDSNPGMVLYTGSSAIDATPFVKAKLGLK